MLQVILERRFQKEEIYMEAFKVLVEVVIGLLSIMSIGEFNYRIGEDLSRRPNMRWQMYLKESDGGPIMHAITFILCWPGLLYGDLVKVPPKK